MDEKMARELATQFREHIAYQGNTEQFDQEVINLIKLVEDQCAKVVEKTPLQILSISGPETFILLIADAIRNGG